MASDYPTTLDTTTRFPTDVTDDTDSKAGTPRTGLKGFLAQWVDDAGDAIVQIQTELGTLPKGSYSNVGARLDTFLPKTLAQAASTANITIQPGGTTLTVDAVVLANGDKLLLKDQTTVAQNGLYDVGGIGSSVTLTRSAEANSSAELANMVVGVTGGTLQGDTQWVQTTNPPITVGTSALRFTRVYPDYPKAWNNPWAVGGDAARVIGETTPRENASAASTLATAATHLCAGGIVIPAGKVVTTLNFHYTTAAATITIFYVSLIRLSDRLVLATSANATGAWAGAPATKSVNFSTPYTPDIDTPVYAGIALAATTGAVVDSTPARAATGNYARAPILIGNTTTPTSTPITGTAGALTATLFVPHIWLT